LNFKTAGSVFGKHVNEVKDYVAQFSEAEKNKLQSKGTLDIVIKEQTLTLLDSHVLKESLLKEHYVLAEESSCRVLLHTYLTEELLQEGQMRELIRTIQDNRKKRNLPVERYITLTISGSDKVMVIIKKFEALLKVNILLTEIDYNNDLDLDDAIPVILFEEKVNISFK